MARDSVASVLGILRSLRETQGLSIGHTSLDFLRVWGSDRTTSVSLRLALGILQQVEDARNSIGTSALSDEAKRGLLHTLESLSTAFSPGGWAAPIQNYLTAIDASITNFAIIASMVDAELPQSAIEEINALIIEIDEVCESFRQASIEPTIRDAAVRQLLALSAMLRNAQAVGLEPALTAYFDLMWQVRKGQGRASEETVGKVKGLWSKISTWGERLSKLSDVVESGSKLIPYAEKVPDLLKWFPG